VAPMTYVLGENGKINKLPYYSYGNGYDASMPTFVGVGRKCDHYPIDNNAFYAPNVSYKSL
jgi:hypothetical protein